jgi:hypothetical protein
MIGRHPECAAIGERKLIESPSGNPALLSSLLEGDTFARWFQGSSIGISFPTNQSFVTIWLDCNQIIWFIGHFRGVVKDLTSQRNIHLPASSKKLH